jgi:hypothetical protein
MEKALEGLESHKGEVEFSIRKLQKDMVSHMPHCRGNTTREPGQMQRKQRKQNIKRILPPNKRRSLQLTFKT